jgi:FMN-dependent NADH-azoreductase
MSKVLYITANPSVEESSYSLSVGRAFLNAYRSANRNDEIVELDVYNMHIPLIDQMCCMLGELPGQLSLFSTNKLNIAPSNLFLI